MAQPTTTPKIEELKSKLQSDPKSRHFFPLAEELRKLDRYEEAEKVLRDGLVHHTSYLSAWISLGRVLTEAGKYRDAIEVLQKALALDGGNVVSARLLAEAYLKAGEKVEAIKKFKLVRALMPNDEENESRIETLDRELNPQNYVSAPAPVIAAPLTLEPSSFSPSESMAPGDDVFAAAEEPFTASRDDDDVFASTGPEPLLSEAAPSDSADVFGDVAREQIAEAVDEPWPQDAIDSPEPREPAAFSPDEPDSASTDGPARAGAAATMTMADLYAKQGHDDAAREIYRSILEREPGNQDVETKLRALSQKPETRNQQPAGGSIDGERTRSIKGRKLESWLGQIKKKEARSV